MNLFNRTAVKAAALLLFLAGISAAGVKYVAVVETEVDAQSGASAAMNPAEVRQITAALAGRPSITCRATSTIS